MQLLRLATFAVAVAIMGQCASPSFATDYAVQADVHTMADSAGTRVGEAWDAAKVWLVESYERAPALVLGLVALLVVPPLALAGRAARWRVDHGPNVTRILRRRSDKATADAVPQTERGPVWPAHAWLAIDGDARRYQIGRSIVRIGREPDNDICIEDRTVHRYHAAVHRTEDAEYVISDLSSAEGNGVLINERQVAEAKLSNGDVIELGAVRLVFESRPA